MEGSGDVVVRWNVPDTASPNYEPFSAIQELIKEKVFGDPSDREPSRVCLTAAQSAVMRSYFRETGQTLPSTIYGLDILYDQPEFRVI